MGLLPVPKPSFPLPVCVHKHTLLPSEALASPASSHPWQKLFSWRWSQGYQEGLVRPLLLAFWLPNFSTPYTTGPPLPLSSCTQAGVPPHHQGPGAGPHAQILLVALPREASASAGHLGEAKGMGIRVWSQQLSPLQPLPPSPPSGSPAQYWGGGGG